LDFLHFFCKQAQLGRELYVLNTSRIRMDEFLQEFQSPHVLEAISRPTIRMIKATMQSAGAEPCSENWVVMSMLGAALGIFFANAGAAYGIAVSFAGYIRLGSTRNLDKAMLIKGLVPAVMASVRGVYGLIISILISVAVTGGNYPAYKGVAHFCAGLCVGLTGLGSGYCMGEVGRAGLEAVAQKPQIYMGVLLIIIFAEALGLYGLIISLILVSNGDTASSCPAS